MKKIVSLIVVLVISLTLFVGCGNTDEGTPDTSSPATPTPVASPDGTDNETNTPAESGFFPSDTETLKIAFNAEPAGMTQPGHSYASSMNPSYIFGQCLLGWDSDIKSVVPQIATDWKWIDELTLELKLRDDVTSIAGDPFTAHDVVFTFNLNNETPALASYYNIFDYEKTVAVDDTTVQIALLQPYPFLVTELAHKAYVMVCEKTFNDIGFDNTNNDPSAQTGPYKLIEWLPGQVVRAERRDDYWDTLPYYKYIELWIVPDGTARSMGVEAGDFNLAFNPAISAVKNAESNSDLKAWQTEAPGRYANMVINSDHEPLNIAEVRQAISLAINNSAMLQIAWGGDGVLSDTSCFAPSNALGYTDPSSDVTNYLNTTDVEAAKQKLIDAGYPDGFTIDCVYRPNEPQTDAAATLLQNQLGAIGITVELRPMDNASFFTEVRGGTWDLHLSVAGNPNPKRAMNQYDPRVDHNAASGSAGVNWYPDNEYIQDLIDKCLFTSDDATRMSAFTEFNDICREYVPGVILYCPFSSNLTSSDVYHLGLDTMGTVDFLTIYPAAYIGE